LFLNLVPTCVVCQGKKLAFYPSNTGVARPRKRDGVRHVERVLHPYFDDFAVRETISIRLIFHGANEPRDIRIQASARLPLRQRRLVTHHLQRIGAEEQRRFLPEVRRLWRALCGDVRRLSLGDEVSLLRHLRDQIASARDYARVTNSIKAHFYRAVARSAVARRNVLSAAAAPVAGLKPYLPH
jgi:hypothetical protein